MNKNTTWGRHLIITGMITVSLLLAACGAGGASYTVDKLEEVGSSAGPDETAADSAAAETGRSGSTADSADGTAEGGKNGLQADSAAPSPTPRMRVKKRIRFDSTWEFAEESKIHTDPVTLWHATGAKRKEIVVAVNAGHGCSGGESEQTYCHPDHTAKVTGGSTSSGVTMATAINSGMTFNDGTKEAEAVLQLAQLVKKELLKAGFDVLMIRDNDDTQLDNIARTVFANNCADCHISLHYDSTASDKGFFYIRVPDNASYKAMEPVHSYWEDHDALGEAILAGAAENNINICGNGSIALDLTQTSYSTVPSVDLEVGDKSSDHSETAQMPIARGIADGIEKYFTENPVRENNRALTRMVQKGSIDAGSDAADNGSEIHDSSAAGSDVEDSRAGSAADKSGGDGISGLSDTDEAE